MAFVRSNNYLRFCAISLLVAVTPETAFAYLDPNAPGLLYQLLFPFIVAITVAWRWVKETATWLWLRITRKED